MTGRSAASLPCGPAEGDGETGVWAQSSGRRGPHRKHAQPLQPPASEEGGAARWCLPSCARFPLTPSTSSNRYWVGPG